MVWRFPYIGKECYVYTNQKMNDTEYVKFTSQSPEELIAEIKGEGKKMDCSSVEDVSIEEGLCVQAMHVGPYDDELATVALMDEYLEQNGYVNDFNEIRLHHEIYLSDVRKVASEKLITVIRHLIRKF